MANANEAQQILKRKKQGEQPFGQIQTGPKLERDGRHAIDHHHSHADDDGADQQEIKQAAGTGVGLEDQDIETLTPALRWLAKSRVGGPALKGRTRCHAYSKFGVRPDREHSTGRTCGQLGRRHGMPPKQHNSDAA